MILDSTYLIDFERECRAGAAGPAHELLQRHATTRLHIPFAALGELAAGYPGSREAFEDAMRPFRVLWPSMDVCWSYAETYRFLRRNGVLIPTNDLWIAATALVYAMPVATRDTEHFRRVPGLEVVSY